MSRTARYHYSKGKVCIQCEKSIVNTSKLGLCRQCFAKLRERRGSGGESQAHRELKKQGIKFLEGMGCQDVRTEVRIGRHPSTSVCDVMGEGWGGVITVVECGGSIHSKLLKMASIVDAIYILPYGKSMPYLWDNGMGVCRSCGHITRW